MSNYCQITAIGNESHSLGQPFSIILCSSTVLSTLQGIYWDNNIILPALSPKYYSNNLSPFGCERNKLQELNDANKCQVVCTSLLPTFQITWFTHIQNVSMNDVSSSERCWFLHRLQTHSADYIYVCTTHTHRRAMAYTLSLFQFLSSQSSSWPLRERERERERGRFSDNSRACYDFYDPTIFLVYSQEW